MEGVVGEYLCGRNYYDHIDIIEFWFDHTTNSIDLEITVSDDKYAWGVR